MSKSDIVEKIKKLLEISRANGATEAEEAAALDRANVLMTKYQIEEHLLRGSIKTKNKQERQKNDDHSVAFSQLRCAIAEFFGVLSLYSSSYYSYYGSSDQVDLAHNMTLRAMASLSLCYTDYICSEEYRKNRRTSGRNDVRLSFRDGFFDRITAKLERLVDERAKETSAATGTNLVVLNSKNLENSFNEDFGGKLKTGRARKGRKTDAMAYSSGMKEGEKFRILNEVNTKDYRKVL